jgi:hypothetical protein
MNCCKSKKRGLVVFMTASFEQQASVTFRLRNCGSREEMVVNLSEEQQVTFEVTNVKTRLGNPAEIDGDVSWAVSDPTAVSLTVDETSPNKRKATVKGLPGTGVRPSDVTAVFDGRGGEGQFLVTLVGQVVVADADAVVGELTPGPVEDQPAA